MHPGTSSGSAEFRAKQLHQKPAIGKFDILSTREDEVLVAVWDQVIRTGHFKTSHQACRPRGFHSGAGWWTGEYAITAD